MKVAKFGGSSVSDGGQINKVANIIKNDPAIRFVVVSAPGKRSSDDIKVTDLLIALFTNHQADLDTTQAIQAIIDRYGQIITSLSLSEDLLGVFEQTLITYLNTIKDPDRLLDALKACGEDFNAQLISAYFNQFGIPSIYLSPRDVGITVTNDPGHARLLPESYDKIKELKQQDKVVVVPGFFGYSKDGDIVTFSRGGSDISGAIIASGVDADVYENFTDVSYIFSAHPGIIDHPHEIKEITYREMRELAYSGFEVFHDEALEPLYAKKIPVQIKNTNAPEVMGTRIVAERDDIEAFPVIGVSGSEGFMSFTIKQYLLNKHIGYSRRLLQIFEELGLLVEHMPTGIDDITVILRANQFEGNNKREELLRQIETQLNPEWIHTQEHIALIAVVGEGMRNVVGLANKATTAFAENAINLLMINQGASEISMFFCIAERDVDTALHALYHQYFD